MRAALALGGTLAGLLVLCPPLQGQLQSALAPEGTRAAPEARRAVNDVPASGAWRPFPPFAPPLLITHETAGGGGSEPDPEEPGVWGWVGRGAAAGALLGPVGIALAAHLGGTSDVEIPATPGVSRDHTQAFRDAYRERVRSRRRTAATVGGFAGTGLFLYVLLHQFTGGGDGGPGLVPPDDGGQMSRP